MTSADDLRTRLTNLVESTQDRVATLEGELTELTRSRRSSSDDDEHDPEGETLSAQWSMLSGLLNSAREEAANARDAVHRFEAGEYGVCAVCGMPIPEAQLDVRPARSVCVGCAK